jgi:hypothetical protein
VTTALTPHPRQRYADSSARAFYRGASMRGLTPAEAGNLTAQNENIAISVKPWTLREIDHLLFLRWRAEHGLVPA